MGKKRDLLIAYIPCLFLPVLHIPLCPCVQVRLYITHNPTRSHINYNQIGY